MAARRLRTAVTTGLALVATVCAATGVASWLLPDHLKFVVWLFLVAFFAAFAGMGYMIVARIRARDHRDDGPRTPDIRAAARLPSLRKLVIVALTCGVVSGAAGLITTSGYSADPPRNDPSCPWRIGTNHGSTNRCVTHARWLQVQDGVDRGLLGIVTLFTSIECLMSISLKVGIASDQERPPGQAPPTSAIAS